VSEKHVHAEDIDAYARRRDSESKRLEIEAHLANCPSCSAKVAAAIEFSRSLSYMQREAADMRASHRTPTDDPATLQVLIPHSLDPWKVRIRDVSRGGMCVRTPKAIDRGSRVKVKRGANISFGEVRYCVPVGDMFHVGLRLLEVASEAALTEE
jgi:hypothetical protein